MKKDSIRNITVTAMFVALTIVLSQIAIPLPFTDVPPEPGNSGGIPFRRGFGPGAGRRCPRNLRRYGTGGAAGVRKFFPAASPVCSDPQADIFGAMLWRRFFIGLIISKAGRGFGPTPRQW